MSLSALVHFVGPSLIKFLGEYMPKWLLNKLYPKTKLLKEIQFGISQSDDINWLPYFHVTIEVRNFSPFDIILDRLILEVWMGQPFIRFSEVDLVPVSSKGTGRIFCKTYLNELQLKYIRDWHNQNPTPRIDINMIAHFQTPYGLIRMEPRLTTPVKFPPGL